MNALQTLLLGGTLLLPLAVGLAADASASASAPASASASAPASPMVGTGGPYARWKLGPPARPDFFPIAVWLQNPRHATRYREAGINTYVGLWRGPTQAQLESLRAQGMRLICAQNDVALRHRDDPTIIGWMHGDEPDNAQSLGEGQGYGPPVPPAKIVADYARLRAADPDRPVLLNLGQGVAWDRWHGRGVRTNHPEDYAEYVQGADIASFDIYPVTHPSPEVAGNLLLVGRGVERLRRWAGPERVVWNCLECSRIGSERKPTPRQVRAQAWLALIHGSQGLIYFVHEWKPRFNEAALLDDPELLPAVTALNREIAALAPVLHAPTVEPGARAATTPASGGVVTLTKRHDGALYVFAAATAPGETEATIRVPDMGPAAVADVLGENRQVPVAQGAWRDRFADWDVHLYRVR